MKCLQPSVKSHKLLTLLASTILASCGGGSSANLSSLPASTLSSAYSQLVWEDNFASDASGVPNPARWAMLTGNGTEYGNSGWGNNELEYYLPSAASVANGVLQIHGHADSTVSGNSCTGGACQFSSGRVTSLQTVDLSQPGYLEVKAELPTAPGSWPAIWLLPGTSPGQAFPPAASQLGQPTWPSGGEIDMAEYLARYFTSASTVQSTLHLPAGANAPYGDNYIYKQATLSSAVNTNYHLYQLKWTSQEIDFAVDNNVIMSCYKTTLSCSPNDGSANLTLTSWPYGVVSNRYYVLFNLAIGGNLGAPGGNNLQVPANYDASMNVAYVRYMTP